MKYVALSVALYLVLGFFLTRWIIKGTTRRLGFRDIVVGPVAMPILCLFLILFTLCEKLWARLLIVLDLDPPEEMRAGPREPADRDVDFDDPV